MVIVEVIRRIEQRHIKPSVEGWFAIFGRASQLLNRIRHDPLDVAVDDGHPIEANRCEIGSQHLQRLPVTFDEHDNRGPS